MHQRSSMSQAADHLRTCGHYNSNSSCDGVNACRCVRPCTFSLSRIKNWTFGLLSLCVHRPSSPLSLPSNSRHLSSSHAKCFSLRQPAGPVPFRGEDRTPRLVYGYRNGHVRPCIKPGTILIDEWKVPDPASFAFVNRPAQRRPGRVPFFATS